MVPNPEPRGYYVAVRQFNELTPSETSSAAITALQRAHQGLDLVTAQQIQTVLGPPTDVAATIVEYPTIGRLREVLASPEYQAAREKSGDSGAERAWAVTGLLPTPDPLPPSRYPRAYVISRYRMEDAERMTRFRDMFGGLMAAHGGRFIARMDDAQVLSGPADGKRISLSEFPSLQHALHGVSTDDFRDILSVGPGFGSMTLWVVNGVAGER